MSDNSNSQFLFFLLLLFLLLLFIKEIVLTQEREKYQIYTYAITCFDCRLVQ